MKRRFAVFLCTIFLPVSFVFAQGGPTDNIGAPGCGAPQVKFAVKTRKGQQHLAQPDAGKALAYFLEDDSSYGSFPKPTTRIGIDGEWVGATHGNSYFYVSVNPGLHHLCGSWQTAVLIEHGRQSAALHFTAKAGHVYYFKVKNTFLRGQGSVEMTFHRLDSDEGQLLTTKYAFTTFHPKK